MQGSPGLGNGKRAMGRRAVRWLWGLSPNQFSSPGCTQLCWASVSSREGDARGNKVLVLQSWVATSCKGTDGQVTRETRTAPWCLEKANRNSTKKQKPPSEMSCSGFLPVSKTSHTIKPARRATHRSLQRKPQTVSKTMSP